MSAPSVAVADGAGRTIRSILAAEFGVKPEQVIDYLRSGDPVERLNTAVEAIESSEEATKSEDYGQIVFVRPTYRYHRSGNESRLIFLPSKREQIPDSSGEIRTLIGVQRGIG
ncbi:hypothetical protein [Halomicrobium salinisoli]|uniref:hypothetical protein n=1 Tax=Halomicrobium salinisoli TaxID=2878391 RepID=UPI001CEFEA62|nr:hypothetical protein [Halomicrobium salinisoli]